MSAPETEFEWPVDPAALEGRYDQPCRYPDEAGQWWVRQLSLACPRPMKPRDPSLSRETYVPEAVRQLSRLQQAGVIVPSWHLRSYRTAGGASVYLAAEHVEGVQLEDDTSQLQLTEAQLRALARHAIALARYHSWADAESEPFVMWDVAALGQVKLRPRADTTDAVDAVMIDMGLLLANTQTHLESERGWLREWVAALMPSVLPHLCPFEG